MSTAIVLPCFNSADTLTRQLEALSRQQWDDDCEIIFVDNGSTDDSVAIFESFRGVLPPSRVVQAYDPAHGRRGVAASYAIALQDSKADAFLFCESDDEVADDWYAVMSEKLAHHDLIAAALDYRRLNPLVLLAPDGGQQSIALGLSRFPSRPGHLYASGCSLGFTRRVVDAIGLPDESAGANWDTDFCIRADLAGIPLTFVPETTIHYRLRDARGARFRQARAWGRGYVGLQVRYDRTSPARLVFRAGRRLGASGFRFRRVLLRESTVQRWIWDLGWAVGIADGTIDAVVQSTRRPRMPAAQVGTAKES